MKLHQLFFILCIVISSSSLAQGKYEWKQAAYGGYTYRYVTNDPMRALLYAEERPAGYSFPQT